MAFWKQALLSLVVLALIGVAWYLYFPGAHDVAARFGISFGETATGEDGSDGPRGPGGPGFGGFGGRTTQVVVEPAQSRIINDELTALGNAASLHSVTVTPQVSGMLKEVLVTSGSEVTAGEVVARLDARSQQIAYDRARLSHADAKTTLERLRQLRAANAISESQVSGCRTGAQQCGTQPQERRARPAESRNHRADFRRGSASSKSTPAMW